MNAPFDPPAVTTDWEVVRQRSHDWRARCLDNFTRAERAVSETLLILSRVPGRGAGISLPLLVGQRHGKLADLIAPEGAFASEGKGAVKALADFSAFDGLRIMLCHGMFVVTQDHKGRYYQLFGLLAFRDGKEHREDMVLEEATAGERLKALNAARQSLCARLESVRKAVA